MYTKIKTIENKSNLTVFVKFANDYYPELMKQIPDSMITKALSTGSHKDLWVELNRLNLKENLEPRFYNHYEKELVKALNWGQDLENLNLEYKRFLDKLKYVPEQEKKTYEQIIEYEYDADKAEYDADFYLMKNILLAVRNLYIYGNAGNGKTTFAYKMAEELDLQIYNINSVKNEYSLKGFYDLEGRYHKSPYENWYEKGGVLLLDECDSYSSNGMLYLNNGIETGSKYISLDNGEQIYKHKDCYVIACGNTDGSGETLEYNGRNKIDDAFMNRFVKKQFKEYAYIHKQILGKNYKDFKDLYDRNYKELTTRDSVKIKNLLIAFGKEQLMSYIKNKDMVLS